MTEFNPAGPPTPVASRRLRLRIAAALTALVLGWLIVPVAGAFAAPVPGGWETAAGYTGPSYFIGQYRNDAGTIAYCTDFERLAPTAARSYDDGNDGPFVRSDGSALTEAQNATLSYLLSRWGPTADSSTAAAVQLAVWALTSPGMDWGSDRMTRFIRDERVPRPIVAEARSMIDTSSASAGPYTVRIALPPGGTAGTVNAEVTVSGAGGTPVSGLAVQAAVSGSFALPDAGYATWTSSAGPHRIPLTRTGFGPGQITVKVPQAPGGGVRWLKPDHGGVQRLLTVPLTAPAEATAPLPEVPAFQPTVSTITSASKTTPGSPLHDTLTVGVTDASGGAWPIWPATGRPVAVDVVSTLWGPLAAPPKLSGKVPEGTARVGAVTTTVNRTGSYKTGPLTVPSPGYYVWTESILPESAVPAEAAPHILPWQGRFGERQETTLVPWQPVIGTALSRQEAAVGDTVTDLVTLRGVAVRPSGVPGADRPAVQLTMYGPLQQRPEPVRDVPEGAPVHSEVSVPAVNGSQESPPFAAFQKPGCYTVVARLAGDDRSLPAISRFGEPEETVCVKEPAAPAAVPQPVAPTPDGPVPQTSAPANPVPAAAVPHTAPPVAPEPADDVPEAPVPPAPVPAAEVHTPGPGATNARLAETGALSAPLAGAGLGLLGLGLGAMLVARRRQPGIRGA